MKFQRGVIHLAIIVLALVGLTVTIAAISSAGTVDQRKLDRIATLRLLCQQDPNSSSCREADRLQEEVDRRIAENEIYCRDHPNSSRCPQSAQSTPSPSPSVQIQPQPQSPSLLPTPQPTPTPNLPPSVPSLPPVFIPEQGGLSYNDDSATYENQYSEDDFYGDEYPNNQNPDDWYLADPFYAALSQGQSQLPANQAPQQSVNPSTEPSPTPEPIQTEPSPAISEQTPLTLPDTCFGDFNNDGKITMTDVWDLLAHIRAPQVKYDLNYDGQVNLVDLFMELGNRGKTC